MVCNELLVVFARLLETRDEYDELLTPIRCLHQIIALELGSHLPMWVICEPEEKERHLSNSSVLTVVNGRRTDPELLTVVPPGWEVGHDSDAPRTEKREINDSVALFTKTIKLSPLADAKVTANRITDSEEGELADEREEYDVISKEDKIKPAFAISRVGNVICWRGSWMRYEEKGSKRAGRGMGEYERCEKDPINMQKDGKQQYAEGRT